MIPIVQPSQKSREALKDRRKEKALFYREARLTLAHEKGSKTPIFSATMGNAQEAGKHILDCIKKVGISDETTLHCVGDGAVWICNEIEEHFGAKATYLIDFYPLCDYLSAAAVICAPNKEKPWLDEQKARMKRNEVLEVLAALKPHRESIDKEDEQAPVKAC